MSVDVCYLVRGTIWDHFWDLKTLLRLLVNFGKKNEVFELKTEIWAAWVGKLYTHAAEKLG